MYIRVRVVHLNLLGVGQLCQPQTVSFRSSPASPAPYSPRILSFTKLLSLVLPSYSLADVFEDPVLGFIDMSSSYLIS